MADSKPLTESLRVPVEKLRWTCDESLLKLRDHRRGRADPGVIGQDDAVDALRFGLEVDAPGQNIFVRGLVGTGRLTLVRPAAGADPPELRRSSGPLLRAQLQRIPIGRG